MSIVAPDTRLSSRLLPAVVAGAIMVMVASFALGALRDRGGVIARGDTRTGDAVAPVIAADLPQWDFKVFPVGSSGGLSRAQKARFEAQRGDLTKLVRKVFDAWTLGRARDHALATHFTPAAAKAARRSDLVVRDPGTIASRAARIGIEGGVPRAAAAEIVIRGAGWKDRATLWLHRADNGWRVIAFDVARKPR